ncbi:DUF4157 domain-containing protein [Flavobacterium sp. MC2016-06]|jgi:hypothetical protein|uniref:eCIS core domain-containing protein n=1 Tax=Flavobacterium sp. MC2016-06 TaxID=2676308 RepID=UPI0012BA7904|nr:DUF4157 domain-containing protein [Flavobacterium sp. MC2016-06]MBU3857576.1 DUF4157 domain-containing protein [Flavobacterium sp. MC2016-06]
MLQHQKKSSETSVDSDIRISNNNAVQLQDNRSHSVIQKKVSKDTSVLQQPAPLVPVQRKANKTGLPDNLKAGMESLSNKNLDHVKVHYNSSKPAAVQALAYAQGSNIHLGPGQEKHLPHELGHVVQQMEGRVKPTIKVGGTPVNNDPALEQEATHMGNRASFARPKENASPVQKKADTDNTAQFQSMDHLGMAGVNYAIMSQTGYNQWQKTVQAKSISGVQQYGDQVVVTQFQESDEIQQYFLSNKTLGNLIILEGILATAAGVAILAVSHGVAFLPGITMIGVGIAKMIRGYYSKIDKPTPKEQKIINGLRLFEAALALIGAGIGHNIPLIIFGAAKALRSLLHMVIDGMDKANPTIYFKIINGIAAALHWIEVTAGFVAGGISGSGISSSSEGITHGIAAGANIGVASSKIARAGNQTLKAKAIKVSETEKTKPIPTEHTPIYMPLT